tara:strand:- start:288 stop:500 length:213 start_codon:yes stop_codon:yes gene_type:complete
LTKTTIRSGGGLSTQLTLKPDLTLTDKTVGVAWISFFKGGPKMAAWMMKPMHPISIHSCFKVDQPQNNDF